MNEDINRKKTYIEYIYIYKNVFIKSLTIFFSPL